MRIKLRPHQEDAVNKLKTGSILRGGVGSGKTLTSLAYFYTKVCGGRLTSEGIPETPPISPLDLYVVTTARKRDSLDWQLEAAHFGISTEGDIKLTVDSWNNIGKYADVTNAFFIFDEQRVVGSGTWAKKFIKITRSNKWILLTATPGDSWMDFISVFIANGFYRNKTQFVQEHVVFNKHTPFPKVDRYIGEQKLKLLRGLILVEMPFERDTVPHHIDVLVDYELEPMNKIFKDRWDIFNNKPLVNAAQACYAMRQVANTHPDRLAAVHKLAEKHGKLIVFYNFNYELETLRTLADSEFAVAEYNGHYHQEIPEADKWIYLVQYMSGAEAWNCIETNAILFYSLNYSYKLMTQAAGRIDRMNTPFVNLYYYYLKSESPIDVGISLALKAKTEFNEKKFLRTFEVAF